MQRPDARVLDPAVAGVLVGHLDQRGEVVPDGCYEFRLCVERLQHGALVRRDAGAEAVTESQPEHHHRRRGPDEEQALLYLVIPPSLLAQPGIQYVALGHIHKHQNLTRSRDDAQVWCWGSNGAGQLGDGPVTQTVQFPLHRLAAHRQAGIDLQGRCEDLRRKLPARAGKVLANLAIEADQRALRIARRILADRLVGGALHSEIERGPHLQRRLGFVDQALELRQCPIGEIAHAVLARFGRELAELRRREGLLRFRSGRVENGGFREPERSVHFRYVSTGSAEDHLCRLASAEWRSVLPHPEHGAGMERASQRCASGSW